jgi:ABC-type multidrug transport system ATPase subunit
MLSASDLGKRFGQEWVFRRLEFDIAVGETLIVTGANGSGKSTLLRILAGLMRPTTGRLVPPPGDPRKSIGYSSTDLHLYPHLSPAEHLMLAGRLRGVEPRTAELLHSVGLSNVSGKRSRELSTGMRARLRLALAIQARPSVLLLDEPSIALDDLGRSALEGLICSHLERGCLAIATNHADDRRWGTLELKLGG